MEVGSKVTEKVNEAEKQLSLSIDADREADTALQSAKLKAHQDINKTNVAAYDAAAEAYVNATAATVEACQVYRNAVGEYTISQMSTAAMPNVEGNITTPEWKASKTQQ